ncbi:hypothetical protein ACIBSV_20245 [Embleya sp. NPDC050154]|uniref:hypothetical protein n=1 Tax=unclassified Embleya TaxID=2699296 RepID=UPI0037B24A1F
MRHHPPTGERTPRHSPGPAIPVGSDNEWDPLEECVVGTARRSMFPAEDDDMCALVEELGRRPLRCPFRHVQSLGGSFHCATLDIRRRGDRPG